MNKKAISIGYGAVIAGIIGIVIIALVIGGPLKGVYNVVGEKIFGVVSPDTEQAFVPYVADDPVYDSIHAFICGTNLVADRSLDFESNCPNIDLNPSGDCKGPHYGRVCVDCEKVKKVKLTGVSYETVACDIVGFELDQNVKDTWARYFIQGLGDPEYLFYYESFPKGEDRYWSADMLSTDVLIIAASGVVSAVAGPTGGLGKETAKNIAKGSGKQAIKNAAKEPFKLMILPFKALLKPFELAARLYSRLGPKQAAKVSLIKNSLNKMFKDIAPGMFAKGYSKKVDDFVVQLSDHVAEDGSIALSRQELRERVAKFVGDNYEELGFTVKGVPPVPKPGERLILTPSEYANEQLAKKLDSSEFIDVVAPDIAKISSTVDSITDDIMKFSGAVTKKELKLAGQIAKRQTLRAMVQSSSLSKETVEQMTKQIDALDSLPADVAAKQQTKLFKEVDGLFKQIKKAELDALEAEYAFMDKTLLSKLGDKTQSLVSRVPGGVGWAAAGNIGLGRRGATTMRDHKLFAIIASGLFAEMLDFQTRKFKDGGEDSLFLSQTALDVEEFPLRRSDTPMLRLLKGDSYSPPTNRFHLVSPCKADLSIRADDPAVCYIPPDNINEISLYEFPEGIIPARKESLHYLHVDDEMNKLYDLLDSQVTSITWQSVSLPAGKPNIVYKRVGDVLYAKDIDNNIFKVDKYTGRFFAVEWGYEQGSAIYAAVLAKGANQWWPGNLVGGKSDWQYAVIDNDLVAKKGSQYRAFANEYFVDVNSAAVTKWSANKIEKYINDNPSYIFTTNNAFLDYHLAKTKYNILFNLNGLFFPTFHQMETAYGVKNYDYARAETPMIEQKWLDTADKSAANLEQQYAKIEWDVDDCITGSGGQNLCKKIQADLLTILTAAFDEDAPQYYTDRYLADIIKWQTEYWAIAKRWDSSIANKYKLMRTAHDNCIKELQNPTNFASCKEYKNKFDDIITELQLADGYTTNKGSSKTFHDYYWALNQTSKQWYLRKRAVRFHNRIAVLAPGLIKYHQLADDELMYFASIVAAAQSYEQELEERQMFKKTFVADIHKANALKDKCVQVEYDSPVSAYTSCRQALNIYSKYAVKDRELVQMSLLFDYDSEMDALMRDADAGILQIFNAPVSDEPHGWAKELFRRLQRFNIGDPGTGCIDRGGIERGPPEWNKALEKKYGVRCRVDSYEAILEASKNGDLNIHYLQGGMDRALLDSLYFAGNLTINTPYFEVREQMITNPGEVEKLTTVFNWIKRLNYGEFEDVNYQITKDIVTDKDRRNVLGIEREWSPSEIVLFLDNKNKDCLKADAEASAIGPLSYYYSEVMGQSIFELCQNGYGGLYPAFLEAQLVPELYSLRPGMTDFINFDHNQIPELRRMARDNILDKRSYPDLLVKKEYVGQLSAAFETAETQAFLADANRFLKKNKFVIDFGRTHDQITKDELDQWVKANEILFKDYNQFINAEFATKVCNKPEGTSFKLETTYTPKAIMITADRSKYSMYNGGFNYCHGGKLGIGSKFMKGAIYFSAIFLDPVVYVTAEVATKGVCKGWCGRAALLGKGAAEAYFLSAIEQQVAWPNSPS